MAGITFISDFERGLYNAIKKHLMGRVHYFQFCYFHYTQAVKKHFEDCPQSKLMNECRYIANWLPLILKVLVNEVISEAIRTQKNLSICTLFRRSL